jgi:hypothetical protein
MESKGLSYVAGGLMAVLAFACGGGSPAAPPGESFAHFYGNYLVTHTYVSGAVADSGGACPGAAAPSVRPFTLAGFVSNPTGAGFSLTSCLGTNCQGFSGTMRSEGSFEAAAFTWSITGRIDGTRLTGRQNGFPTGCIYDLDGTRQ